MNMLCWGTFVFSAANGTQYNKLMRKSGSGFKKQSRMGKKAKKHLTEEPLDTITLSGDYFGEDGERALQALRDSRKEPRLMSNNAGENLGMWTLESLDESQTYIQRDGLANVLSFTANFEECAVE